MKRFLPALLLVLGGCGERIEGIELSLGVVATRARAATGADGAFTTDRGVLATLSTARVTLGSVELFPCEPSAWRRLLHELSPLGTAWAHSASSPRRLGTPHVLDLKTLEAGTFSLGTLNPAPGEYCRARLTFEPADADAQGLESLDANSPDMVGLSLALRGTLAGDGTDAPQPFRVESHGRSSVDVALDRLRLSEESPRATVIFALAYDTWLDGVASPESPGGTDLLGNVARSASLQADAMP